MSDIKKVFSNFSSLIPDGDALLIVPPFSVVHYPSLAVHILQACAQEKSFRASVFYASLNFAAAIGAKTYRALSDQMFMYELTRERVFASVAYKGMPLLGHNGSQILKTCTLPENDTQHSAHSHDYHFLHLTASEYEQVAIQAQEWTRETAAAIAARNFKIVGCTTMFEQTAASIALLNHIKQLRPDIVTILGGANCEGEMAEGIASLSNEIDYIFSGESESTFVDFMQQLAAGEYPTERILYGTPFANLDLLPTPNFQEFYEQLNCYLPDIAAKPDSIELAYETSRGCWWGQKHKCTFCGLNDAVINFRQKSVDKVMTELRQLLARHPSCLVFMTDNIMPYAFFDTLVPQLADLATESPTLRIFYEQKANLSLRQVLALKKAGITFIQPGIESLSTSLLQRMGKGITASQNIALLRYARSVDIYLLWNLLWAFPGDQISEYEEMLTLLPLLHHLQPPRIFSGLSIDRFSAYFEHPETYGLSNIRPWPAYTMVLPLEKDAAQLAFQFTADYECDSFKYPDIIDEIKKKVAAWQSDWETKTIALFFGKFKVKERPVLEVVRLAPEEFVLRDTRKLPGTQTEYRLSRAQVSATLVGQRYELTPEIEWAVAHKVGVVLDRHRYVPLATAEPELILEFEKD